MSMNNLNQLAQAIAAREGLKQPLTIAQIKEVLKIICDLCASSPKVFVILGRAALARKGKKK